MATTEKKKSIAQNKDSKSEGRDEKGVLYIYFNMYCLKKSFDLMFRKKKTTFFRCEDCRA